MNTYNVAIARRETIIETIQIEAQDEQQAYEKADEILYKGFEFSRRAWTAHGEEWIETIEKVAEAA